MATAFDEGSRQPKRVYHSPTRPTARVLEEMVSAINQPKAGSKSSSSSSFSTFSTLKTKSSRSSSDRRNTHTHTPFTSPPLPSLPPLPPLPPDVGKSKTELHVSDLAHDVVGDNNQDMETDRLSREKASSSEHTKSSSSKSKSSRGASLARRITEELNRPRGIHTSTTSKTQSTSTSNHQVLKEEPSPTDSHPHHHREHKQRSRSHSDSHSRTTAVAAAEQISILLLDTRARLAQETLRADGAEKREREMMAIFKKTHEAKIRLERELLRVTEELGLYKIQLDYAQKEIFTAQEIVDKVDRKRVYAEEDAARARSKVYRLHAQLMEDRARDEGMRAGFEEGLRQGRSLHPISRALTGVREESEEEDEKYIEEEKERKPVRFAYFKPETDRRSEVSRYVYPEEGASVTFSPTSSGERRARERDPEPPARDGISEQMRTQNVDPVTISHTRPTHASSPAPPPYLDGTPPDVGIYATPLPRPTITTPVPVEVPSTQPQPIPSKSSPPHDKEQRPLQPERIQVQPSIIERDLDRDEPIRPTSVWTRSPSVMHERNVLPPDNYIPLMDANSVISLPPPHEMGRLFVEETRPMSTAPPFKLQETRNFSDGQPPTQQIDVPPQSEFKNRSRSDSYAANPSNSHGNGRFEYTTKYAAPPSRGASSRGSHISQLDILSPPRDASLATAHNKSRTYEEVESPTLRYSNRPPRFTKPPTEQIAEEWRNANKEYLSPPGSKSSRAYGELQSPESTMSSLMQHPRPPRRPREIVLPAPLGNVSSNPRVSLAPPGVPSGSLKASTLGHASRTTSNATVPGIEVVTPSSHTTSRISQGTVLDPILLTPQGTYYPSENNGSTERDHPSVQFSDNKHPDESSPLSPIMPNLNLYPLGLVPNLQNVKDHPGTMSPNFKYPSSPLLR